MTEDIEKAWQAARSIIKDGRTFAGLKDLCREVGLPVQRLSHLQQRQLPARGNSKSELLDAIDGLLQEEQDPKQATYRMFGAFLRAAPHQHDRVSSIVEQFGWTVDDGQLRAIDLAVEGTQVDFAAEVKGLLQTAYARYEQADYAGAMTAICSAVDSATTQSYEVHALGDPHKDSYQQRANRAFAALEAGYRARFDSVTSDGSEVTRMWQNYKSAVNQSAYVLGSFRRNVSDVHGASQCPPWLVRHAIDCGTFILRSITADTQPTTPPAGPLGL